MKVILIFVLTIVILISACAKYPAPQYSVEKTNQIAIDLSDFTLGHGGNANKVIPVSNEKLIYFSNGWRDYPQPVANVYEVLLSGSSKKIHTISGFHIKRIVTFGERFLVLLGAGVYDGSSDYDYAGLTLMCVDSKWSEQWRYSVADGLAELFVLDDEIILETFPLPDEYLLSSSETLYSLIRLDANGKVRSPLALSMGERLIRLSRDKDTREYLATIQNSTLPVPDYVLRTLDKNLNCTEQSSFRFGKESEVIEFVTSVGGDKLIITSHSVYKILNGELHKISDADQKYRSYLDKDKTFLSANIFHDTSEKDQFKYIGYISVSGVNEAPIYISFSPDYKQMSVSWLENIEDNLICAFEGRDSEIFLVSEKPEGTLQIYRMSTK